MSEIRPELAQKVARAKQVSAAVRAIYLSNGGDVLDRQIRHCDAVLDLTLACRESELARARQGHVLREKGERPHISPSEGRLNSDKLTRYCDRRADLLLQARARVNEVLRAFDPQTDGEFQAALEFAIDSENALPAESSGSEKAATAQPTLMEQGKEFVEMPDIPTIFKSLTGEDVELFKQAVSRRDPAAMERALRNHPPEVRAAMAKFVSAA